MKWASSSGENYENELHLNLELFGIEHFEQQARFRMIELDRLVEEFIFFVWKSQIVAWVRGGKKRN